MYCTSQADKQPHITMNYIFLVVWLFMIFVMIIADKKPL